MTAAPEVPLATAWSVRARVGVAVACAAGALPARMVESLPWAILFAAPPLLAALLVGLTAWRPTRVPAHLLAAAAAGLVLAPVGILKPEGWPSILPAVAAIGSALVAWRAVRVTSQPLLSGAIATVMGFVSLIVGTLAFGLALAAAKFAQCGPPALGPPGSTLVCWA